MQWYTAVAPRAASTAGGELAREEGADLACAEDDGHWSGHADQPMSCGGCGRQAPRVRDPDVDRNPTRALAQ